MKTLTALFLFCTSLLHAGNEELVQATINLNMVENDRIMVLVDLPDFTENTVTYCLPKIVPGTYSVYDFGRFIHDFTAYDHDGNEMAVIRKSDNEWIITPGKSLDKVSYWVEDTYDSAQENPIFEPAGTNIEANENYLLNTFGFIGYVEGFKQLNYELTILKPDMFFGVTPLQSFSSSGPKDVYHLNSYDQLADSPLMYGQADTAGMTIGGAEVQVGVFSPNKVISAQDIMSNISELLKAQEAYLGGKLPVSKYAFIFYFTDTLGVSGGMGALEHMNSSVYYLPEMPIAEIAPMLRDVCAHEFFHIVTPLNIHSTQIADFNFLEPDMSRHLWLYEGQTEYAAHHAQVVTGLITPEEFLARMGEKIETSRNYFNDSLSFTDMSLGCLDNHKQQYSNVYQKGALINMCLDIELQRLSGGTYGTRELMRALGQEYGMHKAFADDVLFEKIVEMTYPEIATFFSTYVTGSTPIPYDQFFSLAGISMSPSTMERKLSLGNIPLNIQTSDKGVVVQVVDIADMNDFGKALGYQKGDIILSINGFSFSDNSAQEVFQMWRSATKEGDKVVMEVLRTKSNGKTKTVKLKAAAMEVEVEIPGALVLDPNATDKQLALRKAWLGS